MFDYFLILFFHSLGLILKFFLFFSRESFPLGTKLRNDLSGGSCDFGSVLVGEEDVGTECSFRFDGYKIFVFDDGVFFGCF